VAVNPGTRDRVDIYSGKDPRVVPAYSVAEAARHLELPASTVRSWVVGRSYPTATGSRQFEPVIRIADPRGRLLSFVNLVEVHVLAAIRRDHQVRLAAVRSAVRYLEKKLGSKNPLAMTRMVTDGTDLFVDKYGQLVNISQQGQMAMKAVLALHLRQIEHDLDGVPVRLYPFAPSQGSQEQRLIAIDPRVQFGRPCIADTRIPTVEVAERRRAGDSVESLVEDFRCRREQIEAAIDYEDRRAA
jgi:uncharacterized protein (DUF433 family)